MSVLRLLALLTGLATGLTALTCAHAADATFGDVARGRDLINARCAQCHGVDGRGAGKAYPILSGQHAGYLHTQLVDFKTGGRQSLVMSEIAAGLSDDDFRAVAAYLSSLPPPAKRATASDTAGGARLFSRGDPDAGIPACQSCHGPRGEGLPTAGVPRLAGQPALYVWAELEAFKSAERATPSGEVMRTVASRLTARDMQDLARYISSLD